MITEIVMGRDALAVHWVANPGDRVSGCLDSMDVAGKVVLYLKSMNVRMTAQGHHGQPKSNDFPFLRRSV